MKIGELAKRAGVGIDTVRYYEREGLLPAAPRTSSNYRLYGDSHTERLAFIRHCRSLDMTLDEVRTLLALRDAPERDCGEANALLDEHIAHVATRMRELRQLEKQLKALRAQCAGVHDAAHCGILNELAQAATAAPPRPIERTAAHVPGTHGHRRRA